MGTRVFFMLALLLPVFVAAHAFGGVLYLLMALVLAVHIKQISTRRRLFLVSILTPPLFAIALAWSADVSGVVPATLCIAVTALLNVIHLSAATRQQLAGNHVSAIPFVRRSLVISMWRSRGCCGNAWERSGSFVTISSPSYRWSGP